MKQFLLELFANESGQDLVEYGMILALFAMSVIVPRGQSQTALLPSSLTSGRHCPAPLSYRARFTSGRLRRKAALQRPVHNAFPQRAKYFSFSPHIGLPPHFSFLHSASMDIRPDDVCLASAAVVGWWVEFSTCALRAASKLVLVLLCRVRHCPARRARRVARLGLLVGGGHHHLLLYGDVLPSSHNGGGDVKLITAIATFAAMPHVFMEMACIALAAA